MPDWTDLSLHSAVSASLTNAAVARMKIKVVKVDYTNQESLKDALQGVETVISFIGEEATQRALIAACVEAGVRRYAPTEWAMFVFSAKVSKEILGHYVWLRADLASSSIGQDCRRGPPPQSSLRSRASLTPNGNPLKRFQRSINLILIP